jgi:hypothetical protein
VLPGGDPLEPQIFALEGNVDLVLPQGIAFFQKGRSLEALLDFYAGDILLPVDGFQIFFLSRKRLQEDVQFDRFITFFLRMDDSTGRGVSNGTLSNSFPPRFHFCRQPFST